MPFIPALCLVFVLAKLAGWITWSWWLVFSPMLAVFALWLICLAILGAVSRKK